MAKPDPQIGQVWRERQRPGHTVEIVGFETRTYSYPSERLVEIKHLTSHNKRVQNVNSITEIRGFKLRYDPVDPQGARKAQLEAQLREAHAKVDELEAEIAKILPVIKKLTEEWERLRGMTEQFKPEGETQW